MPLGIARPDWATGDQHPGMVGCPVGIHSIVRRWKVLESEKTIDKASRVVEEAAEICTETDS